MDVLDRLRELDRAASAGPWRVVTGYPQKDVQLHSVLGDGDARVAVSGYDIRNVQLAVLSHLLLPLAEALDGLLDVTHWEQPQIDAQAVLAKLEEALG